MVGWVGPALQAGATIASGIFGASAADEAAEKNWQINLLNYYQQAAAQEDAKWQASQATADAKNERRLARADAIESRDFSRAEMAEAKKQAAQDKTDARLGTTDAQGNRSYFKEGVGWVSELSPVMQSLQDRYVAEEQAVLDNDLPKQRDLLNRNYSRQLDEGDYADSLRWRMGAVNRRSASDVENELNGATALGIQEGYGSALEEAMRAALRTGSSNAGEVAAAIGRDRSSQLQKAFISNKLQAKNVADSEYGNEVGNLSQLYQQFASRASADPNIGYNPRNMNVAQGSDRSESSALLSAFGNNATALGQRLNVDGSAVQNAIRGQASAASQSPTLQGVTPNFGVANAIGGAGAAVGSVFERMQQQQEMQDARDFAMKYRGNTGKF